MIYFAHDKNSNSYFSKQTIWKAN